jgi:hypothetical protein
VWAWSRGGLRLRLTPVSGGAAAEELDIVGHDLGHSAVFAFFVLEGVVLQPALDVDEIAFLDVLGRGLGQPFSARENGVAASCASSRQLPAWVEASMNAS